MEVALKKSIFGPRRRTAFTLMSCATRRDRAPRAASRAQDAGRRPRTGAVPERRPLPEGAKGHSRPHVDRTVPHRRDAAGLNPAARHRQYAVLILLACVLLISSCTRDAPAIDSRLLLTPLVGTKASTDTPATDTPAGTAPARAPTLNATVGAALIPSATPTRPAPSSTVAAAPTAVSATNTSLPESATPTRTFTGRTMTVKAYMIARGDGGASGPKIGCGDSVVAVNRTLPYSSTPLTDAMKELLTIHDPFYGQSGLYNSLSASRLQVESVALSEGVATIRLTGTVSIAGECDDPRFEAQLRRTALQFASVRVANIYINGKGLGCLTSGKGC